MTQPPTCSQDPIGILAGGCGTSEDWLYLNVFVPQGYNNAEKADLPFMIWV